VAPGAVVSGSEPHMLDGPPLQLTLAPLSLPAKPSK
jgi:hypothetical protein